jgi:inner membrane protein
MASIGHVLLGMAVGRRWAKDAPLGRSVPAQLTFAALAMLPDADVVAFKLGIPYAAPLGHRGASHSVLFALGVGALTMLPGKRFGPRLRRFAFVALTVASHGVLDALTNGGLGVGFLWPLSPERFFFPLRPLPVAPIGAGFLSMRGLEVAMVELGWFVPALAYALWPRRAPSLVPGRGAGS